MVQQRMSDVNMLIVNLEDNMISDMLIATSKVTLLHMVNYTNRTQTFFYDKETFEKAFNDMLYNGTIEGIPQNVTNDTIVYLLDDFMQMVNEVYHVNLNITVDNSTINISQATPFGVGVNAIFTFSIHNNDANWLPKTKSMNINFSLDRFPDPYYLLSTKGNYTQRINISDINEYRWNRTLLNDSIPKKQYYVNRNAPSFLQRFYNDTENSSVIGIESFINPETLKLYVAEDVFNFSIPHNRSYIDYLFWSVPWDCWDYNDENNTQRYDLHNITGINYTGFRLEDSHLNVYLNTSAGETRDISLGGNTFTVCANPVP